jgi:hypothetical protein
LFDTVACASSRRLDAGIGASERHDLAVRFSIIRPARCCSPDAAASTASRTAFVTCARPSVGRTARISELIWVECEVKYFCKRGLTRFLKIRSDLPVGLICRSSMPGFDLPWRQISTQQGGLSRRETHQRRLQHDGYRFAPPRGRHSGMVRRTRPQMCNCTSGNLEIPGSMRSLSSGRALRGPVGIAPE